MEKQHMLDGREITRIVESYSDMLLRIALNRVQSLPEAEDIVQTVYMRLMRSMPQFRDREHERAWLIRTAVNLCLDYRRSAARRTSLPLDEEAAEALPMETLELLDVVRQLPETDRYAIYLYYYEQMPATDIAALLGIPEGTVTSRLTRARRKLRALLKGESYGTV